MSTTQALVPGFPQAGRRRAAWNAQAFEANAKLARQASIRRWKVAVCLNVFVRAGGGAKLTGVGDVDCKSCRRGTLALPKVLMRTTVSRTCRSLLIAGLASSDDAKMPVWALQRRREQGTPRADLTVRSGESGLSRSVPMPCRSLGKILSRSGLALFSGCAGCARENGQILQASAIQIKLLSALGQISECLRGYLYGWLPRCLLGAHRSAPEQVLLTSARVPAGKFMNPAISNGPARRYAQPLSKPVRHVPHCEICRTRPAAKCGRLQSRNYRHQAGHATLQRRRY